MNTNRKQGGMTMMELLAVLVIIGVVMGVVGSKFLGQAEDLAPMALAVLSNRVSAYVTGAAIAVDGGLSLMNWFEPPGPDDL